MGSEIQHQDSRIKKICSLISEQVLLLSYKTHNLFDSKAELEWIQTENYHVTLATIELRRCTWSTAVRPVTGDIAAQVSLHRDLDLLRLHMCRCLALDAANRHPCRSKNVGHYEEFYPPSVWEINPWPTLAWPTQGQHRNTMCESEVHKRKLLTLHKTC